MQSAFPLVPLYSSHDGEFQSNVILPVEVPATVVWLTAQDGLGSDHSYFGRRVGFVYSGC